MGASLTGLGEFVGIEKSAEQKVWLALMADGHFQTKRHAFRAPVPGQAFWLYLGWSGARSISAWAGFVNHGFMDDE